MRKMQILEYTNQYRQKTIDLLIRVAVKEFGFKEWEESFKIFENEMYKENNGICYVAIDDKDNVIGTISLRKIDNFVGEVKNFYVEKEYRGTGISQDLLDTLTNFAKERGYEILELDSYKEFSRALNFYKKNNFFVKSVEDNKFIYYKLLSQEKITVIVSIYNIEKYLENCIKSIINQKYRNLQILLIDDGSTDTSGEICDKYAKIDNRIEVIHKKNGGLADARNSGISLAKGKYISFIDGDDYIYPTFYMDLYYLIKKYSADISECDFLRINEGDVENAEDIIFKENEKLELGGELINGKEAIDELFGTKLQSYIKKVIVCNKLYSTKVLKDIKFPLGRLHEDEYTTYKILNNSNKVITTKKKLYGYIQTRNSIMRREIKQKRIEDNLDAYIQSSNFFRDRNNVQVEMKSRRRYLEICIALSGKILKSENKNKAELLKEIQDKFIFYYEKYLKDIVLHNSEDREKRIIKIIIEAYEDLKEKNKNIGEYWAKWQELLNEQ